MRRIKDEKALTRVEMEVMNIIWDYAEGVTTRDIQAAYPEPQPAYSTLATYMKILTEKGFISPRKKEESSKTLLFVPIISREEYTNHFMKEVKESFFGNSFKSMLSFFARQEDLSEEELKKIMTIINKQSKR